MHIINIINKSKLRLTLVFLFLTLCFGCRENNDLGKAQESVKQSQEYHQQAIKIYLDLIAQGEDLDKLHFQLGKLYYEHGDFLLAIEELKKSKVDDAKGYLAISYYRAGNFVDAMEVSSKNDFLTDQGRYYYGLTAEKLNLFDQALSIYNKIKSKEFLPLALARIELIEKQANLLKIQDLSPEVNKIISTSQTLKEFPQAGALILLSDEKIKVTPENTQISQMHYLVKILNNRGKENFSESHIDYDSTYERVELEFARTIKPDGTVVDVGSRHIRDVSRYLNFPLYSNARVYIISFPEITEGAVIEYKVKIFRNQLINKKDFVLAYPIEASEPVITAKFELTLPKQKLMQLKIINEKYNNFGVDLKPKIDKLEDRVIYTWEFNNIPQIIPESNMPNDVEINPTMIISTFNSWQDIYSWWWGLAHDKMKADSAIKDKVRELVKNETIDEAKIRAIYNFCAQKIRYVAVEYGQAGYQPHNAADIFKNKYGDCKDQAILLVTMLKEAGFSAYPALISTKEYYNLNPDFPMMLFNHVIAAVGLKDTIIFMDPTAETCSFDDLPVSDQQRKVLLFKEDTFKIQETPLYQANHNLLSQSLGIKINQDETIICQRAVSTGGVYDQAQRYWLVYTPPDVIKEKLREKIQDISIGAKLISVDIKNLDNLDLPVVLNYSFSGQEYFTNAGAMRIMPQLASLDNSLIAQEKRKYPIDFTCLDTKEAIFEIAIPDNFVVKYIPKSINEDSPWLSFSAEYSHRGNKICFKQKTELKKALIREEEYAGFKAFFEELARKIKQRIILEKAK